MVQRHALTCVVVALVVAGCGTRREQASNAAPITKADLAVFAPLPVQVVAVNQPLPSAKIQLGRALYYENLLSKSHDVSCNSCHPLNGWGADGRRVSLGHDGTPGNRNAPTVYHAAGHTAQFWDGRAKDVEEQAKGPILNPVEMGMPDSLEVLTHLRGSPAYVAQFRAAFPDDRQPVTYDNVGKAIGAFERGLLTPSRWDRFVAGEATALTPEEQQGLRTYLNTGCQACHAGTYMGGDRYMKAGAQIAWFTQADSGRFAVTRDNNDLYVFKVPSLRNVQKTAPYFHDGSVADLGEAVRLMAHHQLGKTLGPADVQAIETWMSSMTGDLNTEYIAYPQQPRK